ncbi:hypothetical protein [Pseudodesulfovibrio piezophilus]|nr:hypothetical protein [Pseudodesulfovibrio piezophilus]
MKHIRDYCQHVLNPLHIFCRLRRIGFSIGVARNVSRLYEVGVYRFLL